jgi:hypothetical protein
MGCANQDLERPHRVEFSRARLAASRRRVAGGAGQVMVRSLELQPAGAGLHALLVAIPPGLGERVRPDFAFEFVAFARFLEALSEDAALTVHDLIAASIAEAQPADALVFSISTGLWPSDLDDVLSNCVETAALSMLHWVAEPVAT